jgi:hypothetical protein
MSKKWERFPRLLFVIYVVTRLLLTEKVELIYTTARTVMGVLRFINLAPWYLKNKVFLALCHSLM